MAQDYKYVSLSRDFELLQGPYEGSMLFEYSYYLEVM